MDRDATEINEKRRESCLGQDPGEYHGDLKPRKTRYVLSRSVAVYYMQMYITSHLQG